MIYKDLPEDKKKTLTSLPIIVTFMVAGADNEIDDQERLWAERLIELRASRNDSSLLQYYNDVEKHWDDHFAEHAGHMQRIENNQDRLQHLNGELAKANPIMKELEHDQAIDLYQSLRSYGEHIARASGGFLGFGSISAEEAAVLPLKVLYNPSR